MRQRTFAARLAVLAVVVLIAVCTGPAVSSFAATPTASAGDLTGAWNGLFWWVGGEYYEDEGTAALQIEHDGSYTVAMTPAPAANNIAVAQRWSGTLAQPGRLVVFRTPHGRWSGTWSSLERSGDTLYGVAKDPATGADIEIRFERARTGS